APNRLSLCKMSSDEWRRYFRGHWTFSGTRQEDHIAMFPEELPYRLMRMFSLKGDKILDPFLGSGTTLKVAEELDRIGFGMEFNSEFLPIIQKKVKSAKNSYNDFETIGKYLNDNCDYWKSEIYIDKQKRKGIYVMSFPKHNIAIDLINISKSTSDIEIIFRIERKLKERQISEILPDDKDISYYYIIVEGIQSSQLNSIINSLNIQDKVIICSYDQIITPDPDVSLIYQNSL
ncbi:MAG: site-specific DNA-methyltransferase, partial [Candidatus Heimdallarchaeota archaeon]|nr:site-specific DNA-methyltransferase [Candidatus Heimdallarchaeota archaeon]